MDINDRLAGVAVGAAVGDALGMPLEFAPRTAGRIPSGRLVREMQGGRCPAGAFTDDTEMALALADSLLERFPFDPDNLAAHFVAWYRSAPDDMGIQTTSVLHRIASGEGWEQAATAVQASRPDSAGNGSVMRCWPVALAYHEDREGLIAASALQSKVTHPHEDCLAGSVFVNVAIYYLIHGVNPVAAVDAARRELPQTSALRLVIAAAPGKTRDDLRNTGWVRHTIESAIWGLLTTDSFEEAVVQVANLGEDADTAASVAGALAGAAYGLSAIPGRWRSALGGRWPLRDGLVWNTQRFEELAYQLAARR